MKNSPLVPVLLLILAGVVSACTTASPADTPASTPTTGSTSAIRVPTDTPVVALAMTRLNRWNDRPGHVRLSDDTAAGYAYRSFLQIPFGVCWGADGFLYAADWTGRHIVRIGKDGAMSDLPLRSTIETLDFDGPRSVAFDSQGNLFFNSHDFIFQIAPDGTVTKLEGVVRDVLGSVAVSPADELYYTDRGEQGAVRKWLPSGESETIAADLPNPENLTFARDGTLYFTLLGKSSVMKVDPADGTVSTFAEDACGNEPCFLAVDGEGDIWVRGFTSLRQFSPAGTAKPFIVDGNTYPGGPDRWSTAGGIAFDDEGGLWIASFDSSVIRLIPKTTGTPDPEFTLQKIAPGFQALSLDVGSNGELYATNTNSGELWKILPDGTTEVILDWSIQGAVAVAVDNAGEIFLGMPHGKILHLEAGGELSPYADILTRRMVFGADGALYAIAGAPDHPKSLVRISGADDLSILAAEIDGIPIGNGEAHISPATDQGLYIFTERERNLFFVDFTGQGRLIANLQSLGGGRMPAVMAASPVTGDIFLVPHGPYVLYRITPEGASRQIASRIMGDPWGMVVSQDGHWLYIAESGAIDMIPV